MCVCCVRCAIVALFVSRVTCHSLSTSFKTATLVLVLHYVRVMKRSLRSFIFFTKSFLTPTKNEPQPLLLFRVCLSIQYIITMFLSQAFVTLLVVLLMTFRSLHLSTVGAEAVGGNQCFTSKDELSAAIVDYIAASCAGLSLRIGSNV